MRTPIVGTKIGTGVEKAWRAPAEEDLAHGEVALLLGLGTLTEVGADVGAATRRVSVGTDS
jgi:hypothetical protein